MTNSPKIKKLINDLKKNNLKSRKKDNHPEIDATQQLLLKALNENLKKSLQEKKVVNIRNSYKFVLGAPEQQSAKPSKRTENIKNNFKQAHHLGQPFKSKLKSKKFKKMIRRNLVIDIENMLKNKIKLPCNISTTTSKIQNSNPNENFKPLSARTHDEMAQNFLRSQTISGSKTPLNKNKEFSCEKEKKLKRLDGAKPAMKVVPKLNLESLMKNNLEEVKFFTPREHKKNL